MKYLLDTCVVSETRRREPNANLMNWLAKRHAADLFVSVVTLGELRKGACSLKDASRRQVLEKWIDEDVATGFNGRVLGFERSIADRWGRLMGEGIAKGLTPSVTDSMLAATALSHGMTVGEERVVYLSPFGNCLVDGEHLFEVGIGNKIPLWLFGFLY